MKISFIVPVYKKAPHQVKKALESLIQQSHRDIEIIVVFDGPNPELEGLVAGLPLTKEGYPEPVPMKVIVHPERRGAPAARNTGKRAATGAILSFWDADCYAEPEMANKWIAEFIKKPEVDFVYSGYAWTDPGIPGYPSEMFDPWVLTKYNYIASMFPIKAEKCPDWDESLTGLQDWDFWRRVVDAGGKGAYLPVFGFTTDFPDSESISGQADKNQERIRAVRAKHGDMPRDVLVCGTVNQFFAKGLAKVLAADYIYNPFYHVADYKAVICLGMHQNEMTNNLSILLKSECKRVIYWTGFDADALVNAPYAYVKSVVEQLDKHGVIHWADDKRTVKSLESVGIKPQKVAFPHLDGNVLTTMPKTFKGLVLAENQFEPLADSIIRAMPDMDFQRVVPERFYDISQFSAYVQLTFDPRLGEGAKNMLRQGRYVVSNVEAPYSGFIEMSDLAKAKVKIVRKLRSIAKNPLVLNRDAQAHYMEASSPKFVRNAVKGLLEAVPTNG